jgi:hypothetical protein
LAGKHWLPAFEPQKQGEGGTHPDFPRPQKKSQAKTLATQLAKVNPSIVPCAGAWLYRNGDEMRTRREMSSWCSRH